MSDNATVHKGDDFYRLLEMCVGNADAIEDAVSAVTAAEDAGEVAVGTGLDMQASMLGAQLDEEPSTFEEVDLAMESANALRRSFDDLPIGVASRDTVAEGASALLETIAALGLLRWVMLHGDFPKGVYGDFPKGVS